MLPLATAAAVLTVSVPGGALNGTPVLGTTVPEAEAAFGAPTSVETYPNRRDLAYRGRFELIFAGPSADPAAQTAWGVLVIDPDATAPRLGRFLSVPPRTLERRLRTLGLREVRRYRCDRRGCFGTFFTRDGKRRVIYGLLERRRRYLGVQAWPNP